MDPAADVGSVLLQALESSDYKGLHRRFADFLLPFGEFVSFDFRAPEAAAGEKPRKKQSKKSGKIRASITESSLRPLAKRFLPFLCRALQLLPNLLRRSIKSGEVRDEDSQRSAELLSIYDTTVACLSCLSPCLAGKPYSIHLHRARRSYCLETWGRYRDAENECVAILEEVTSLLSPSVPKRCACLSLPDPESVGVDGPEVATLFLELIVCQICCAYKSASREAHLYKRVITLVEQVQPWLRLLDPDSNRRCKSLLVNNLFRCSVFLACEATSFDEDLVLQFCLTTIKECLELPSEDVFLNVRRLCSSIDKNWKSRPSLILEILRLILEWITCLGKVDVVQDINGFLEAVSYFADACYSLNSEDCCNASKLLHQNGSYICQVSPAVGSILILYAFGLLFKSRNKEIKQSDYVLQSSKDASVAIFFGAEANLNVLKKSIAHLSSHFEITSINTDMVFDGVDVFHSHDCLSEIPKAFKPQDLTRVHGYPSFSTSFDALEFSFKILVDYANKIWNSFVSSQDAKPSCLNLIHLQELFYYFCDLFHSSLVSTKLSESNKERLHESHAIWLQVAVSAFKLSLVTSQKQQKCLEILNCVMSSTGIVPDEIRSLRSILHNVAALLYNIGKSEEASMAMRLFHKAIWIHVKLLYDIHQDKTKCVHGDGPSLGFIRDVTREACVKTAWILDFLHKSGYPDIKDIIVESLFNLSFEEDMSFHAEFSSVLVEHWVKLVYKDFKYVDTVVDAPVLYWLLSRYHTSWSMSSLGNILEQELRSVEKMGNYNRNLCAKMGAEIIDILLDAVFTTENFYMQRSKILIWKARSVRTLGTEGLSRCMDSLSEAISILERLSSDNVRDLAISQQLALALLLHAMCAQETNKGFKLILQDIQHALSLLSNLVTQGYFSSDRGMKEVPASYLSLLCSTADLLSLKGHFSCHSELFKLIISFYKIQCVPIENCLVYLWNDKRLNHALCSAPIDKKFLLSALEDLDLNADSLNFWMRSTNGFSTTLLGLVQNFLPWDSILDDIDMDYESHFVCKPSVDEIRKAALSLITEDSLDSISAFKASSLYYDLSERLISRGRLVEALKHAKEALGLRRKILRKKFILSLEQLSGDVTVSGRKTQNLFSEVPMEVERSVAVEIWPDLNKSRIKGHGVLSPWSVLRSYLESILQVACIYELSGNCLDAEILLRTGKMIATMRGLPIFGITFSLLLSQIYRKKKLWDLAENEINIAKNISEKDEFTSCKECKLIYEANIAMQTGDLSRYLYETGSQIKTSKGLSYALSMYRCAYEKLNNGEPGSSFDICTRESLTGEQKKHLPLCRICTGFIKILNISREGSSLVKSHVHSFDIQIDQTQENMSTKGKVRASSRNRAEVQNLDAERKPATRSRQYPTRSRTQNGISVDNKDPKISSQDSSNSVSCYRKSTVNWKTTDNNGNIVTERCWGCLVSKTFELGSMHRIIDLKLECHRIRILLKLLPKIARCLRKGLKNTDHEVHEVFIQRASLLIGRYTFSGSCDRIPFSGLINLIQDIPSDVFPIERALMLHDISWLYLKDGFSEINRSSICCLVDIRLPNIITWLLKAFILGRELPFLLHKVSMLLSCLLLISTVDGTMLPFFRKSSLSLSHWAAYFHQTSIYAGSQCQFLSLTSDKVQCTMAAESSAIRITEDERKRCSFLRQVPEKLEDLVEFVRDFYRDFPDVPVICISMLGDDYINLIGETLLLPSFLPAWVFVSRFFSTDQPCTIILPIDFLQEAKNCPGESGGNGSATHTNELVKAWECPWGNSIVDCVAPLFKTIMEDNFTSLLKAASIDSSSVQNSTIWWTQRKRIDKKMNDLLTSMEQFWLGSWACLLLGDYLEPDNQLVVDRLVVELKSRCKFSKNDNILKVILGGSRSVSDAEVCLDQIFLYNGYFGRGACCGKESFRAFTTSSDGVVASPEATQNLLLKALGLQRSAQREPVILVLDSSVQMLPWENLPILRSQEVYRMPSVMSIFVALRDFHDQVKEFDAVFPSIDPSNAFYLLNPSGDLQRTQVEFEQWFLNQKFEGYAGRSPTSEELALALQNHDLFLYLGHGNGTQYIGDHRIQKLDRCAATLLMGCSSGCLKQEGPYAPHGAPLSYLFAGSPAIIANLWEVTDKDIDRFARSLLDSWLLQEEQPLAAGDNGCELRIASEIVPIRKKDKTLGRRRKDSQKGQKLPVQEEVEEARAGNGDVWRGCRRTTIAASMSKARDTCRLPYLIGASPVCYGVPTILKKRLSG